MANRSMSPIKLLNYLLRIDNFLGIYRNYCGLKRVKKYFVILHIFVLFLLHTIINIDEQFHVFEETNFDQKGYIYRYFSVSAYTISLLAVVIAFCYSSDFMSFYTNISRLSERFKDDKKLMKSIKKLYWFTFTFVIGLFVFASGKVMVVLTQMNHEYPLFFILLLLSQGILRTSSVFQYLMLFDLIMILFYLLKSLISLMSAVQKRVESCDISSDEQCDISREQIQEWVELYRDLAICCDKVTICFGRQFFVTLAISISNYIFMLYKIVYRNTLVDSASNSDDNRSVALMIFGYLSVMVAPLAAGQLLQNQGVKFHRVLARLYNTMIINYHETESKLVKDFIRLIKKNKIEIKLLSKVSAGMHMLPLILTLTVNYVIVMLQFNHVI